MEVLKKRGWCLLIPPGNWVHDLLHVLMFWWLRGLSACWFRSVRFLHGVYFWFVWSYVNIVVLCVVCVSEIADYFLQPKTSLTHWLAWHMCCFLQANSQGTCATMLGLLPGKWMHVCLMYKEVLRSMLKGFSRRKYYYKSDMCSLEGDVL